MKERILSFLSEEKRPKVEPLIDDVLASYNNYVEIKTTENISSRFIRNVALIENRAVAVGQIELSTKLFTEEALVHELLHLAMPLTHGVYAIGFNEDNPTLNDFATLIQNVLEHDMFLEEYLEMGYSIDRFLGTPTLKIDYDQRREEDSIDHVYWMHEYFRLSIAMAHIPLRLKSECRNCINNVKRLAFKEYPHLKELFPRIKSWIDSKKFHFDHFNEIRRLFKIFQIPQPVKILALEELGVLKPIYFKDTI